jgi:hypothetical protein
MLVMLVKTKKAIADVLNAYADNPHCAMSDELDALATLAVDEGFINWVNGGYSVPDEEAPDAPDVQAETLGRIVAVFEAFEGRKDTAFNEHLTELESYSMDRGWIGMTSEDGYVVSAAKTPVLPFDALELIVYVLNARANDAVLTFYDGMDKLSRYLISTELIDYDLRAGYSIPDTEAPEPRIIPFTPKGD